MDALGSIQTFDLIYHEDAGSFGLCVPETRAVDAVQVEVGEVHGSVAVGAGCYVYDAGCEGGGGRGKESGKQELEE
jgi:hypothetical protein